MIVWTGFVLGLIGSLHCAAMCGPIAMAVPVIRAGRKAFWASRLLYNAGRVVTYALMGGVAGLIGQSLAIAGLQRWLSLTAGGLILLGLLFSRRASLPGKSARLVGKLKSALSTLLKQRTPASIFLLGLLNGLLPCGLVYVASAGAVAAGELLTGMLYMIAFGIGTLPMMLGVVLAGKALQSRFRFPSIKLVPITAVILGLLLIARGLALEIPYFSPSSTGKCPACERPVTPAQYFPL